MSRPPPAFVRDQRLPPDPSSPARARAFVTDALRAADRDGDIEIAALLVSETVTNAVLHAGTDVEVHCRVEAGVVRVEVRDGSSIVPGVRHYDDGAMTGRGLGLVELLAGSWGVERHVAGKTVWFELGATGPETEAANPPPTPLAMSEVGPIRFLGLPVGLVRMTIQYGDAVLREVAFLAGAGGSETQAGWHASQIDLTPILEPVDAAWETGTVTLDLDVEVSTGAGRAALERMAHIDEADRMAREGLLLSIPALPEIGACRRWLFGQIALQSEGASPTAWELPELGPVRAPAALSGEERADLAALSVATIVADDANRIVFSNDATAELLGWPAEELVGSRLTTVVPRELREAHLVGFTRYQLTGTAHILGRPVRLPALHRDGRRVLVDLVIEATSGHDGRTLFRATLAAADNTPG